MEDNSYILKKYLEVASSRMKGCKKTGGKYQFFCNVCGDDTDSGNRNPRGALMQKSGSWFYKCFNGGCTCYDKAWSGSWWLKFTSPDLFSDYRRELFGLISESSNTKFQKPEETKKEKVVKEYKFTSILKDGELEKKAREFCISRKIPEKRWRDFSVCYSGAYKERLIIPFNDNKGDMYYFQARTLTDEEPKYKNPVGIDKDKGVYNLFGVDWKKPVIVCEGPIDSMFLENAIAVTGSSVPEYLDKLLENKEVLYLWDNDDAGRKNARKYLKRGNRVFLWSKMLKDVGVAKSKDVNELLVKIGKDKFTMKELENYFSNDMFDELVI